MKKGLIIGLATAMLLAMPVLAEDAAIAGTLNFTEYSEYGEAAAAAGTDGIMVEVHNNPACALCDGAQSLTPAQFDALNRKLRKIREVMA